MSSLDEVRKERQKLEEEIKQSLPVSKFSWTIFSKQLRVQELGAMEKRLVAEQTAQQAQPRANTHYPPVEAQPQQAQVSPIPRGLRDREDDDEYYRRGAMYIADQERRERYHREYHQREHSPHDERCPYNRG